MPQTTLYFMRLELVRNRICWDTREVTARSYAALLERLAKILTGAEPWTHTHSPAERVRVTFWQETR